ncbi:endonuclease/exonuclease/phosphatase family protein [Nocardioides lijunqiniae]|uniref:endonuclease/exonuclease/phosphatase family protein n=1 Tax=Nocardioides lijunqiniae TaxID=2760832 RepID=UPI0018777562|nr:endonuclease/exonuclease/phosphatase family protein [Nocardioides lijunqiniae]
MTLGRIVYWCAVALLLLPALALTGVRLLEPDHARAIQLGAFTPFGLPLYAAALVLLLVGVLRGLGRRALVAGGAVLALAGLLLHAAWYAPLVTGTTPAAASDATPVVLMTANLFKGAGDAVELLEEATAADVDVLVVSELTRGAVADMETAGLADAFPYRAGEAGRGTEGTMVFSHAPVEVVETLDTIFDGLLVRTAGLSLLAVHPYPPVDPVAWREDHAQIRELAASGDATVIAGDLNATLDQAPLRALVDDGFRDSAELANAGVEATWPVGGGFPVLSALPPSVGIDHVMVTDQWTVTDTRTVTISGADHRAVLVSIAARADR